jgi:hypothetical protein
MRSTARAAVGVSVGGTGATVGGTSVGVCSTVDVPFGGTRVGLGSAVGVAVGSKDVGPGELVGAKLGRGVTLWAVEQADSETNTNCALKNRSIIAANSIQE